MIRNYLYKCPECSGEYVRQEKPEGVRWCAYCKALITLKFVEQLSKEEMEDRTTQDNIDAATKSPVPEQEPVPVKGPFTFKCAECGMIHPLDTIPHHKITCSGCYHTITTAMIVE